MKKKILWPTDFSRNSEKALPFITSFSKEHDSEIHVLYVIQDYANHDSWYGDFSKKHIQELTDRAGKSAKKRLDQICEKYMDGCPLYIRHTAIGEPAKEILKLIEKEHIDMVVMTSDADKNKKHFRHISETVLDQSPIPVKTITY